MRGLTQVQLQVAIVSDKNVREILAWVKVCNLDFYSPNAKLIALFRHKKVNEHAVALHDRMQCLVQQFHLNDC